MHCKAGKIRIGFPKDLVNIQLKLNKPKKPAPPLSDISVS